MSSPRAIVGSLRPGQWVKNLLVAAAPAAAGVLDEGRVLARVGLGFVAFSCAASAVYLFNDAADIETDRHHPTKRHRPIAAGDVQLHHARSVALALAAAGFVLAVALDVWFGLIIAVYLGINLAYSAGLKRVPYVELVAVASGFFLRAISGGRLGEVSLSWWFLLVVSAGSLFVVTGKRTAEFDRVAEGATGRSVLAAYTHRSLAATRAAAGAAAVVGYALWAVSEQTARSPFDILSLIPFGLALIRYDRAVVAGQGEEPEQIFRNDPPLQAMVALWAVLYGVGVYA